VWTAAAFVRAIHGAACGLRQSPGLDINVEPFDSRKAVLFVGYADRVSPRYGSVALGLRAKLTFRHRLSSPLASSSTLKRGWRQHKQPGRDKSKAARCRAAHGGVQASKSQVKSREPSGTRGNSANNRRRR